jgi:hypothetical protein
MIKNRAQFFPSKYLFNSYLCSKILTNPLPALTNPLPRLTNPLSRLTNPLSNPYKSATKSLQIRYFPLFILTNPLPA